jgi:hypothetical protein
LAHQDKAAQARGSTGQAMASASASLYPLASEVGRPDDRSPGFLERDWSTQRRFLRRISDDDAFVSAARSDCNKMSLIKSVPAGEYSGGS